MSDWDQVIKEAECCGKCEYVKYEDGADSDYGQLTLCTVDSEFYEDELVKETDVCNKFKRR